MARYLLVVHEVNERPELVEAARALAAEDSAAEFVLLVPATASALDLLLEPHRSPIQFAARRAQEFREQLLDAGLTLVATRLGNSDPFRAMAYALAFSEYSAVVVAAPRHNLLHHIHCDLACRLARRFPHTRVIHAESYLTTSMQKTREGNHAVMRGSWVASKHNDKVRN